MYTHWFKCCLKKIQNRIIAQKEVIQLNDMIATDNDRVNVTNLKSVGAFYCHSVVIISEYACEVTGNVETLWSARNPSSMCVTLSWLADPHSEQKSSEHITCVHSRKQGLTSHLLHSDNKKCFAMFCLLFDNTECTTEKRQRVLLTQKKTGKCGLMRKLWSNQLYSKVTGNRKKLTSCVVNVCSFHDSKFKYFWIGFMHQYSRI